MASNEESNLERLKRAGLTVQEPLPQPYIDVIEGLSDDEVKEIERIVGNATYRSVAQRLDEATAQIRSDEPNWRARFLPPF